MAHPRHGLVVLSPQGRSQNSTVTADTDDRVPTPSRDPALPEPWSAVDLRGGIANARWPAMHEGTIPIGMVDGQIVPLTRPTREASRRTGGNRFGEYKVLAPLA